MPKWGKYCLMLREPLWASVVGPLGMLAAKNNVYKGRV